MNYELTDCICGNQARIVDAAIGVYIRCPHCNKDIYMQSSKSDALRLWKEKIEESTNGSRDTRIDYGSKA